MNEEATVLEETPVEEAADTGDIIRNQSEVEGASMAQLVRTYNELGFGKVIKKFENRASGMTRVTNAIMLARDAHGHMGVPQKTELRVMTLRERVQYAIARNLPIERAEGDPDRIAEEARALGAEPTLPPETFPEGSVAAELAAKAEKTKGKPERTTERKPRQPKLASGVVQARDDGTSKLHPESARYEVWKFISDGPDRTRSFEELEAKYGKPFRSHLQKLAFKNHVTIKAAEPAA